MVIGRRLALAILLPLALAVAASFAVAFLLPEALSRRAQEARLVFRLETLRAAAEANLALGLPVTEIAATQDLIERAQRADPDLLAVDVFDTDGVTLYSTDLGVIGEPVPAAWRSAAGHGGIWRLHAEGEALIALPVRDDLGDVVAMLAGVTAAATIGEPVAALRRDLIGMALWLLPLAFGSGAIAADLLARRAARPGRAAAAALRDGGGDGAVAAARQACLDAVADLDAARANLEAAEHAA